MTQTWNPWNFIIPTLKVSVTKFQAFFDLRVCNFQSYFHYFSMHVLWQEKLSSLGSKNPWTFVTETFKVGFINFQGFSVLVTSYFHHFVSAAPNVKRGLEIYRRKHSRLKNNRDQGKQARRAELSEWQLISHLQMMLLW